jgi:hypothetical protein
MTETNYIEEFGIVGVAKPCGGTTNNALSVESVTRNIKNSLGKSWTYTTLFLSDCSRSGMSRLKTLTVCETSSPSVEHITQTLQVRLAMSNMGQIR